MDDNTKSCKLHFPAFNLLSQIFRSPAYHQAADKDGQDSVHNHIHQAYALAAEDYIQHHVQKGNQTAQGSQGIVHVVDCTGGKEVVVVVNIADCSIPNRTSFPSMLPIDWLRPASAKAGLPLTFCPEAKAQTN